MRGAGGAGGAGIRPPRGTFLTKSLGGEGSGGKRAGGKTGGGGDQLWLSEGTGGAGAGLGVVPGTVRDEPGVEGRGAGREQKTRCVRGRGVGGYLCE